MRSIAAIQQARSLRYFSLVIDIAALADSLGSARQSEYVSAAADTIDDIHEIAGVQLHVVGHHIGPANLLPINRGAARLGVGVDGRDVVGDLDRIDRVADVPNPHAGVEIGNEGQSTIVGRIAIARFFPST